MCTKFRQNPRRASIFCVDLTWNDPIVKKGIQAFPQPNKAIQRKRKCSYTKSQNKYAKISNIVSTSDVLAKVSMNTPGRPRLKRIQRKKPALPRQVSTPTKSKMLKAAALLRQGMLFGIIIIIYYKMLKTCT